MDSRRMCKVFDAKAAHRAWSKRRMLLSVVAMALAASLSGPSFAYADDAVEQVGASDDVQVTVERADSGDEAANAGDATDADAEIAVDDVVETDGADDANSAAGSTGGNTGGETSADVAAKMADSLGTTINFDYDGDGTTTESDWVTYLNALLNSGSGSSNYGNPRSQTTQEKVVGLLTDADDLDLGVNVEGVTQYYLNNVGQATSVKQQTPWNDCWSFAAISALESSILKVRAGEAGQVIDESQHTTPQLTGLKDQGVDLSELYFAWLSYSYNASGSQKGEGIESVATESVRDVWASHLLTGFTSYADALFGAWRGIASEEDYPYYSEALKAYLQGEVQQYGDAYWANKGDATLLTRAVYEAYATEPATNVESAQIAHVDGVYYLPSPNVTAVNDDGVVVTGHDANADKLIKQALVKYGAVVISLMSPSGASAYFNDDNAALYDDAYPRTDHAVTIVGWNDDYLASNFATSSNDTSSLKNGAWLIKNSWGSSELFEELYGVSYMPNTKSILDENGNPTGYFWLSYYDHTIANPLFFSVDDGKDGFDYDNNYSYDTSVSYTRYPFVLTTADEGTYVANVFVAEGDEVLKAVSVRTSQSNSHATIWVYLVDDGDLEDNDPTNDGAAVLTMEYDAALAGLHTVTLTKPINLSKGQRFVVVENVTSASSSDASSKVSWLNLETAYSSDVFDKNPRVNSYYRQVLVANDGETFARVLTTEGYQWLTPQQLAEAILDGTVIQFGSAMVKAYTTDVPKTVDERIAVITEDASGARHIRLGTSASEQAAYKPRHMAATLPRTGDAESVAQATGLAALAATFAGAGVALRGRLRRES